MRESLQEIRKVAIARTLRACQLFSSLPAGELEEIAGFVVPKALAKGDYVFHEGDNPEGFFVVQRGAINVHRVSPTGKEQVVAIFRPNQSFAEAALSGGGYPASARAIEPAAVLMIRKTDILALLRRRPELALEMLGSMSQHLRVVVGLLDDLTLKNVEARLVNWILKRCPKPLPEGEVTIELDLTKRVLAAEIGTVSETLSRTLKKLRGQKLIRVEGRSITVLAPRKLERLLLQLLGEE